jgi:hypothetical protein
VIQYVPDPVANERINVGIAGYSEGQILTRFLVNWQRVRALAGKGAAEPARIEALFHNVDDIRLREMIETWQNSIQFTPPSSSLRSLEETVDEAARRFLVEPPLVSKSKPCPSRGPKRRSGESKPRHFSPKR